MQGVESRLLQSRRGSHPDAQPCAFDETTRFLRLCLHAHNSGSTAVRPLRGRGSADVGLLHTVVSEPGAAAVTREHMELPAVHRQS